MRLLVSGATATIRRLLDDPRYRELAQSHLGHLLTPANGNRLDTLLETGLPIGVDNNAFANFKKGITFDWRGYQRFAAELGSAYRTDSRFRAVLRFVATPDAVGDWRRTFTMWRTWFYLKNLDMDAMPWAYVAQDGQTPRCLPFQGDPRAGPWVGCRGLFIGGSTEWKCGVDAETMVRCAQHYGRWVHVGRVNSFRRLARFDALGVNSFDGGQFSMFPDTYIPRYLERIAYQQRGMNLVA